MGMFDDLVPKMPKAQPPAPAKSAGAKGGMFDDLIPAASAEPDLGPYPMKEQKPSSWWNGTVFSDLLKGWFQEQAGAGQGTYPEIRKGDGSFARPLIGEVNVTDDGSAVAYTPDGERVPLNSDKHVIFFDDATGRTLAFSRTSDTEETPITSAGRLIMQGMGPGPVAGITPMRATALFSGEPGAARTAAVDTFTARQANQAATHATRVDDAQAFDRLEIPAFPPAMGDKGTARAARTIEELPIVGRSVKTPRNLTEQGMARTQDELATGLNAPGDAEAAGRVMARPGQRTLAMQEDLARRAGAPADAESAGAVLQRGMDRFRNAPISQIDPVTLRQMQVNPTHPVAPSDIMTPNQVRRAATAEPLREAGGGGQAQTHRGVDVPMARTRTQVMGQSSTGQVRARVTATDMEDAELQRIVSAPARETSFAAKQEALYEQARRLLPPESRSNGSANPQTVPAVNTRGALRGIEQQIASQISGQSTLGGPLAERIMNAHAGNFPLRDLSAIRTEVGRSLSNFNPMIASLDRGQLRTLYGALSRDIELGLIDVSNRAWNRTRIAGNAPNRATIEEARRADAALFAFRRADRFTRAGMGRMERFMQLAGAENPADAARALGRMLNQSSSNAGSVDVVQSVLRQPEWQQVSAFMVSRWGAGQAESIVRDFMRLTPQAQRQIAEAVPPALRGQMRTMLEQSRRLQIAGFPQGEEGVRALGRVLRDKTSDHARFRSAMDALEPAERQEMAGYLISQLGKGRAGAKEAESTPFNSSHFMTDWEGLGSRGQDLLLSYIPNEAAAKLRDLAKVAGRMKYYETTKNYSGSAYSAFGLGGLGSLMTFDPFVMTGALASYGGAGLTGKLLTSPRYLDWLLKTKQLQTARGLNRARWTAHVNNLRNIMLADPDLAPLASVLAENGVVKAQDNTGTEPSAEQQQGDQRGIQ